MTEKVKPYIESLVNHEYVSCKEVVAVALCGGFGSRLTEITKDKIPKSLVRINNLPLFEYSIIPLLEAGIEKFIFATGHKEKQIRDYVLAQNYSDLVFFSHDYPPPGITISLQRALDKFDITNPIVVFDTDVVRINIDFKDAYTFHKQKDATITLVCTQTSKPRNSHFVVINDKNKNAGLIVLQSEEISIENPIIKCGMIICSSEATSFIRENEDIPNSWIGLIEYLSMFDDISTYITPEPLLYANVNTPYDLLEIEEQIINQDNLLTETN